MRTLPLEVRKARLARLLSAGRKPRSSTPSIGKAMARSIRRSLARLGFEGIVSKRRERADVSGPGKHWIKPDAPWPKRLEGYLSSDSAPVGRWAGTLANNIHSTPSTKILEPNMADDPTKRARDNDRIDVSQDYECRYWSEKWNISPEELKRAVSKAGVMVKDVARELGKPA